jgi:hypothetical protein
MRMMPQVFRIWSTACTRGTDRHGQRDGLGEHTTKTSMIDAAEAAEHLPAFSGV